MAKIVIPEELKGKELFEFLKANKDAIIKQKKSFTKTFDGIHGVGVERIFVDKEGKLVSTKRLGAKAEDPAATTNDTEMRVKVVANACWWCDTDMDVLVEDSSKRTIQQRKGMIPHLHDHIHTLEAKIGEVEDIYLADVPLRELGLNKSGSTQCIIFETLLIRDYNPKVFDQYSKGRVQQHSIGLLYVKIELAMNYEESEKEYDFWKKYYDKVINKDVVDEKGYFWVVSEIKLLENSAVLFGANELTPTLESTSGKSHSSQTEHDSPGEDPADKVVQDDFNIDVAIITTNFFK